MITDEVKFIVERALKEDIGKGDITTGAIYSGREEVNATFIAKQNGVIAGLEIAQYIFREIDHSIQFEMLTSDGELIQKKDKIASVNGPAHSILIGERTVLNFMQRMSGIATRTRQFVDLAAGTNAKILDTRKTAPGQRYLDKWAVRLGGGTNHRMRLDDRFLLKENHIAVAGSIENAIQSCIRYRIKNQFEAEIEIEVRNLEELEEVLRINGVDYIMLDNMSLEDMSEAVKRVNGSVLLEASGNVSIESVRAIAETGVDFISIGSLTHSVQALDISLLFVS